MANCTVSGTFLDPSGTAIASATVRFNIDTPVFDAGGSNVVSPKEISTTTASDGTWSLAITQGASGTLTLDCPPDSSAGIRKYTFACIIPAQSTAAFSTVWADSLNIASATYPLQFTQIQGQATVAQLPVLASTNFWVGNGSSVATAVAMSGDATMANTGAVTVATVGASTAANIHTAELLANAATAANTASALMKRDGAGQVAATTFTGALVGNASTATTVTTNANLTGPITSVGNATAVAAQTGTGTTFVMQGTPTLTTPVIGAATGTSLSVSGQLTSTVSTGTAPLVVSSTTQVSNLNAATAGTATNATNVATTQVSNSASYYPLMVSSSTNGNQAADLGTGLTFNPSTNTLTTTTFSGALTGNATNVTGTVAIANGGTGQTTKAPAFDALQPMTTGGDIIYGGASGTGTRLANGVAGQFLKSNGTTVAPSWANAASVAVTAAGDAAYAVLTTDYYISATPSVSRTITLPTAVGVTGQIYEIQMISGAGSNPIATTSSQTIGGRVSSNIILACPGDYAKVVSDGTNWQILDKKETKYLTQNSDSLALSTIGNGNYGALTNNSLALTPGQWRVSGYFILWTGTIGANDVIKTGSGFYAANGANTSTPPTALSGNVFGNPTLATSTTAGCSLGTAGAGAILSTATLTLDISITSNTTIYLVPLCGVGTASNADVTTGMSATRIW